ncbi:hypothetical protein [Agriterribacter sp.]|uniref:hypothetical protein n=1 Tax=Agriterribacter sp. TaxID=2821509 RepID=UPI002B7B2626|nr:hypothetical protein [Agriterribacter sp.]HRO47914.1 hypothetical protein [Agriterribacter sp.]HRQ18746.1 hypothetical protein [Agriterribacter sp.]
MKTIFALFVLVASAGTLKAQTGNYHFTSNQQQQVKYDSANKVYFIDREINRASDITIEKNIISFVTAGNDKSSVYINNISLESLANRVSFTLSGRDILSGKHVKLGFWFIAGVLDEVSYTNEAIAHSIAYKDLSDINETASNAIAAVHTLK